MVIEELKWKKFPVLSDGFVCLVDVMGDDSSIAQAARVSYGAGTKKTSDDRGLIRYLMRHRHSTPFEMVEVKLLIRVPMDTWRQWIRHRTANVNEYSTRYSEAIDSNDKTDPAQWRLQSGVNKQGSGEYLSEYPGDDSQSQQTSTEAAWRGSGQTPGAYLSHREDKFHSDAIELYRERLAFGVAREQARKDLPLSTYTEAYWKCDLHNILHFLGLRMDSHAQKEIRDYATIIGEQIIKPLFPIVWEAFEDYRLDAMYLTGLDLQVIQRLLVLESLHLKKFPRGLRGSEIGGMPYSLGNFLLCQDPSWEDIKNCRERDECFEKLVKMKICHK